ncbi:OST3/OST6 family protein [Hypoxylon argillaceum]|nr:OST3/OST6 family protein [Hypoxylon argillaceum]KAI1147125.1 OST3/OST6 family protein [Nemania diffusa]
MRWLPALLSLAALPLGSYAAKSSSSSADRFQTFHTQAVSSSPLKLVDATYKKLTSAPRDYSVAVLLTALDAKYGCQLCGMFQPEWDILGKSWTKGDKNGQSRLILSTLDFSEGRETFMSLGLQTAPVLLLFQPTTGPHAVPSPDPLRYDFQNGAPTAEQVHDWLARHLPGRPHPSVYRPVNYARWVVTTVSVLGVLGVVYKLAPYLLPILKSRNVWAGLSLIAILCFTSGHMFNQIRKVPYVTGDGRGGISYFAGGFQSQYGLETQIIAFIYGLLSFATISLALKAPRTQDHRVQQLMTIGWGIVLVITYSFLLSIFRVKNGGYPFKLPPFM